MSAMLAEVLADSHGYTTLNLGDNMLGDEAVAEVGRVEVMSSLSYLMFNSLVHVYDNEGVA
jgi:hypothetical protein